MPRAALGVAARVNVSVLYQFVDTANRPWPTNVAPAAWLLLGRAARGSVSRKMACRPAAGNSRTGRGSLVAAPSNWGNGRQDAQPCFARRPVCRSFAQAFAWMMDHAVFGSAFLRSV